MNGLGVVGWHIGILSALMLASIYWINYSSRVQMPYARLMADFFSLYGDQSVDKVTDRFLQAGSNTCGPAALAYVLNQFGEEVHEADISEHVDLTELGTNMLELQKAATDYGFEAIGYDGNYAALRQLPLPLIAYINNNHYVVVIKVTDTDAWLFDPAIGHIQVSRFWFEKVWNGYMLLVRMRPIPGLKQENHDKQQI
jgi:ABC-type bacteriocin/lantibiotic exporter with double-glycine peptidase domain